MTDKFDVIKHLKKKLRWKRSVSKEFLALEAGMKTTIHFHDDVKLWDWFVKTYNPPLNRICGDKKRSKTFFYSDNVTIDGLKVEFYSPSFPNPKYDARYEQCRTEYSDAVHCTNYFIRYLFHGYLLGHVKIVDIDAINDMADAHGIDFSVQKDIIDSVENIDCFLKCLDRR